MSILVIAAHPDDEVLGCGGTIAKSVSQGLDVNVIIAAEGFTSRQQSRDPIASSSELESLRNCAYAASSILGVSNLDFLELPDNRMDSINLLDVVKLIEQKVDYYSPSTVFFHHCGDVNIDHTILHKAVCTACRPMPGSVVKSLISFEVPSSTEWQLPGSAPPFIPNWYVDISDFWEIKLRSLEAYAVEMRPWPHARSIEALWHLASLRGSQVGFKAAEAFCLLRKLA